ncbi:hypothetical protein [Spiroplasma apis]|uniref:Uncharacterized protein n=1 Tax=Spiroplasma apis B31 TaxID=1276258 RepID=V5RJQ1_SPIAP|nr:hypothetical protein [Spiroplasma apis]AHB36799.1 hypothetical protein SAPIS_v1c09540 [Spiroplasma apis B31]
MINDISDLIALDESNKYILIREINSDSYVEKNLSTHIVNDVVCLSEINEALNKVFPYFPIKNTSIVDSSINQNQCIKEIIEASILQRSGPKVKLVTTNCNVTTHLNLAKRYITEINNFIYKYNIKRIYWSPIMCYFGEDMNYFGTIDLVLDNGNSFFIIGIKTSRTNYNERYSSQLFLEKKMFEYCTDKKIASAFILNVKAPQVWFECKDLDKKSIFKLQNYFKNLKD